MTARASSAEALLALRTMQRERAERRFADRLAEQGRARASLEAADTAIAAECDAATALDASDGAVEAFARWLPVGRARRDAARATLEDAAAETALARVALRAASIAVEVAGRYAQGIAAERAAGLRRAEQAALDELAGARHGTRHPGR